MSSENYVAINVTNIPEGKHQGTLATMSEIAQSSISSGAYHVSFGMPMSGLSPEAAVFLQVFEGPLGFENVMEAFQSSSVYSEIIQEYWVTPYLPSAVQLKNVAYAQSLDPIPNYLILSESKYVSLY